MSSIWRPTTTGVLLGGLVVVLLALVASFIVTNFRPTTQVKLGSGVFSTRVASTQESREKGLSGVTKLGHAEGLLMVFETDGAWPIWMKDMNIPIDILWLNKDKAVIHIVTDASPEVSTSKSFVPTKPARYVLELSAGTIKKSGIAIGSKAEFELEEVTE